MVDEGDFYMFLGMKLNLALTVPKDYLELIYDCIMQMTVALDYAHNNNLIHGGFDLSNILVTSEGGHKVFKLNNFKHGSTVARPL